MAKPKKEELPRKGTEAVKFIEKKAKVIQKRQEGSHVFLRVKGPEGETVVVVNVHGSQEMSIGVWHKVRKQLIRIGVLSVIILALVLATYIWIAL